MAILRCKDCGSQGYIKRLRCANEIVRRKLAVKLILRATPNFDILMRILIIMESCCANSRTKLPSQSIVILNNKFEHSSIYKFLIIASIKSVENKRRIYNEQVYFHILHILESEESFIQTDQYLSSFIIFIERECLELFVEPIFFNFT